MVRVLKTRILIGVQLVKFVFMRFQAESKSVLETVQNGTNFGSIFFSFIDLEGD